MIVKTGEKLHVIVRRRFEEDIRRHFVGLVTEQEGAAVRSEGYSFIYNRSKNEFVKKPEKRFGIFDLASSGYVVNILPDDVILEDLSYKMTEHGFLVLSDGKGYSLDINELGAKR